MSKSKKLFAGLDSILDVIYGALISFVLYTITTHYFAQTGQNIPVFSSKFILMVLIGIYMLEDYCSVRLVNSIAEYSSTNRFALDMLIAFLFLLTFQALNINRIEFVYFIGFIHFLSFLWAFVLLIKNIIGDNYVKYLRLTLWTNGILFGVCFFTISFSKLFKGIGDFEMTLNVYLISYVLIQILLVVFIKFKILAKKWWTKEKETDLLVKESGPMSSKFIVLFLLLSVHIGKAVISFIKDHLK